MQKRFRSLISRLITSDVICCDTKPLSIDDDKWIRYNGVALVKGNKYRFQSSYLDDTRTLESIATIHPYSLHGTSTTWNTDLFVKWNTGLFVKSNIIL